MKLAIQGYQDNGKYTAVALQGTEQQIQDTYNTLWQWQAINGALNECSSTFGFVWVKPEQFLRGLTAIYYNRIIRNMDKFHPTRFKGVKGGVYPLARALAQKAFDRIFAPERKLAFLHEYDGLFGGKDYGAEVHPMDRHAYSNSEE